MVHVFAKDNIGVLCTMLNKLQYGGTAQSINWSYTALFQCERRSLEAYTILKSSKGEIVIVMIVPSIPTN